MDGVIIMIIATCTVSSLMYLSLQGNTYRRHRLNSSF